VIVAAVFVVLAVLTVITDIIGEPPTYLTGLLGTAGGVLFAAIGSDKNKRDQEVAKTAQRAEAKADALTEVAAREHPEHADQIPPPGGTGDVPSGDGEEVP